MKMKRFMLKTLAASLSIILGLAMSNGSPTGATAEQSPVDVEDFVLVQGDSFSMGSPEAELERGADEVVHEVTVDSFYIAKHEVTQAAYSATIGHNPSFHQGDDLPVENLTWYEAVQYCNALSAEEGLTPCYAIDGENVTWSQAANGYRLPTEAEWEYACRAGTTTPFHFGDYVNDSDANCYNAYGYNNDASGNWANGYLQHTTAVGSYGSNALGLYDMHGNVCEWVWDWYDAYDDGNTANPTGSETGHFKVARGGGWNDFPKHIRSAYRSAFPTDAPLYSIGIRLVRNATAAEGSITSTGAVLPETAEGKVLIVYFSQTGNTEGLAEIIAEMTGADVFRIERETPYSASSNAQSLYAEALDEDRQNAFPLLRATLEDEGLDIEEYDTVLLGYCNWWASIPAPVRTFLDHYDMSGKTIIPFCSQGGGRFGQTISAVAKLAPDSVIREGLWVNYSSYPYDEIAEWLNASGVYILN